MFAGWKELLDDTEPMDTSDSSWWWFYQAECGIWHRIEDDPVNPISSSELEMLYLRNPNRIIIFSTAGSNFRIDFHGYMKTNVKTGQVQKIKRSLFTERAARCKCADLAPSVPTYWEHMDPNLPFKAFNLNWQTSEYNKVENYVKEFGLLKKPLRCIYRIQNIDLWELYCRKKKQLMRIKGTSDINEEWLFHGTGKNNVHNICLYNFNCRISKKLRKHGHILGKGTYFAKHAAYADKYSTAQNQYNTTQIMFLARVIVGNYTEGRPDLVKPDGDQIENIHDSCVDNTLHPRIFVVFNSNQIYPEYVLEYGE
ncbi:protein mono-ADP-ribosyltransferase PARP11 [Silurus meridionalis]|uniref:protein mono-ADP-ribosyltransferase PARP11 n=1 Tax=Silurus meridionalis TaxID=175797 RepID=UPI001EEB6A2B|nr:protein mono-ADP-ribosyltransferase PARP11 [Silurus meridionalis]